MAEAKLAQLFVEALGNTPPKPHLRPLGPLNARVGAGFEVRSVQPIDCRARNGFCPPSHRDLSR
jgi:hypothetical protein